MRYIIYGAGAVGGSIGAALFEAGREVVLIARGDHLQAIQRDGLSVRTPNGESTSRVPVVGHPSEVVWRTEDIVLLTVKSQHTSGVLHDLAAVAGDVPVVCAQNGVANERMALRRFSRVYAMMVMLPATHIKAGRGRHARNAGRGPSRYRLLSEWQRCTGRAARARSRTSRDGLAR